MRVTAMGKRRVIATGSARVAATGSGESPHLAWEKTKRNENGERGENGRLNSGTTTKNQTVTHTSGPHMSHKQKQTHSKTKDTKPNTQIKRSISTDDADPTNEKKVTQGQQNNPASYSNFEKISKGIVRGLSVRPKGKKSRNHSLLRSERCPTKINKLEPLIRTKKKSEKGSPTKQIKNRKKTRGLEHPLAGINK